MAKAASFAEKTAKSVGKKDITVVKLIRSIKSEKTGAYSFKEEMVPLEQVKDLVAKK